MRRFRLGMRHFHVLPLFSFCLPLHFGCRSLVIFIYFWQLMFAACDHTAALQWMRNWCCTDKLDLQHGNVGSKCLDVWCQWIPSIGISDCELSWRTAINASVICNDIFICVSLLSCPGCTPTLHQWQLTAVTALSPQPWTGWPEYQKHISVLVCHMFCVPFRTLQ